MESTIGNTRIERVRPQEIGAENSIGKYLDKHVVTGRLYVIEQTPDFLASCLYKISKSMLVFSSKLCGGQLLVEAAQSEINSNHSKSKKEESDNISHEMMLSKKICELEKKPIWIDDSENLMAMNLYARCQKLKTEHDLQVVLMDDYRFLLDDYFQEISDELRLTMLLKLAEKMGIALIVQECPIEETQEGNKGNASDPVFHNKWWDDTPKPEGNNSIFDYWEA